VTGLTYRASGVDPTRADMALALVRERIARTKTPEVIGDIGAFGGLFASPGADRVLVATTDGVGTKLDLARLLDRHEVVGTDLVHHCINDAMAMGAYEAVKQLGLAIPQDVAIVGFDNHELIAGQLSPPLTTMELPHYAMGQWAVQYLFQHQETVPMPPTQHTIPCRLIERSSV